MAWAGYFHLRSNQFEVTLPNLDRQIDISFETGSVSVIQKVSSIQLPKKGI